MDKRTRDRLKRLTERVIASDATEISIKQKKYKPARSAFIDTKNISVDSAKKEIVQIYDKNPDYQPVIPGLIVKFAKKYLDFMAESIPQEFNPGYHILRQRFQQERYHPFESTGLLEHCKR